MHHLRRSAHGSAESQLSHQLQFPQHAGLSVEPQPAGEPGGHQIHPPHHQVSRWTENVMSSTASNRLTVKSSRFRDREQNYSYELPPGVHRYNIPRSDFGLYSQMKIYVRAANKLGEAISEPVVLEPMSAGEPHRRLLQYAPTRFITSCEASIGHIWRILRTLKPLCWKIGICG